MANKTPNLPPDHIFEIDLNPCKPFLVDMAPGATKGMRTEQDGWTAARAEILANQPKLGGRAGITATDFNRFTALDAQIQQVEAQLPRVTKAVEVVRESLSHLDNQRHKLATQFANSAESHSSAEGGDPTLLTAYEKTIEYRGVVAAKGVKTRQKNKEQGPSDDGAGGEAPAGDGGSMKASAAVSRIPSPPPESIFTIDLTPLKPFLVDLPPRAMRGMRTQQEGWEDAAYEILQNQAKYGDRAGITALDHARFVTLNEQFEQLVPHLPLLEKAQEILEETLAHLDNQRHKLATQFAGSAESHASAEGGDPTLLTAYEKAIAYRGVVAARGLKTKARKESAGAAKSAQDGAGTGGPSSPVNPEPDPA